MRYGIRGKEMEAILEWIRSLVYYLILMTVVANVLPDKKYEKYLRLFVGMVFLMLVLTPFADLTGFGEKTAEAFARLTYQNDAKLLRKELEFAEKERMDHLIRQYEGMIVRDIQKITEEMGIEVREIRVLLDQDPNGGRFGQVKEIDMMVSEAKELENLKRRIGGYYGMEEGTIAIRLEAE